MKCKYPNCKHHALHTLGKVYCHIHLHGIGRMGRNETISRIIKLEKEKNDSKQNIQVS